MELAEQITSLVAVFGLLAAAVWVLSRKRGGPWFAFRNRVPEPGALLVVDRLVLTPQHSLHLVRVGDRTVLLATHPHGIAFDPGGGAFLGELRSAFANSSEVGQ